MLREDLNKSNDVVLGFSSATCSICRKMKPMIHTLLADNKTVNFVELDIDEEEDMALAQELSVTTLPTFIHFNKGEIVGKTSGFQKSSDLKGLLNLD